MDNEIELARKIARAAAEGNDPAVKALVRLAVSYGWGVKAHFLNNLTFSVRINGVSRTCFVKEYVEAWISLINEEARIS